MGKVKQSGNGTGTVYPRKNKAGKVIGYRGSYFDPAGKRRYVSAKNKGDAEKALRRAMTDADRGIVLDAGTLTVAEYLERWLSDCLIPLVTSGKMEHSTYVRYAGNVNNHISPTLGRKRLRDLTRAEVRALYSAKGKELSPRSVDYIHVTLQKALSQAMRDDLIPRNVAAGERPRSSRNREEIKALSSEQARALLTAARGERNEALYVVAVHTGLRQGELLGLKWADLDLADRRLSVRRALKVTDHGLDFGPPKNRKSRRSVPLNKSAVAALRDHRTRQNEERLRLGDLWQDHDLVFPTASASRWITATSTTASTSLCYKALGSETRDSPSTACGTPSRPNSSPSASARRSYSLCSGIRASCKRWTLTRTCWTV
jgi:integrase